MAHSSWDSLCMCMCIYIYIYIYIYKTRLASNEIFSPSNKINREVGQTKDLSAPLFMYAARARVCRNVTYRNTRKTQLPSASCPYLRTVIRQQRDLLVCTNCDEHCISEGSTETFLRRNYCKCDAD